MAETVPPANVPPTAAPPPVPTVPPNSAQIEYDRILSYFKYMVTLSGICITVIAAVAGGLLYSNVKDVREDARQEATRVATTEARNRVAEAFDDKHVNGMILQAATDKIGTITDKMIQD